MDKKINNLYKYLKRSGFSDESKFLIGLKKEASLFFLLASKLFGCKQSEFNINPIYYDAPDCVNVEPTINFRDMEWNIDNGFPITYSDFKQALSGSEFNVTLPKYNKMTNGNPSLNIPDKEYAEITVTADSVPMPIVNNFIKASGLGKDNEDIYSAYKSSLNKSDDDLVTIAASFYIIEIDDEEWVCINDRHVIYLYYNYINLDFQVHAGYVEEEGYGDLYSEQDFELTRSCAKPYKEWINRAYKNKLGDA